jgi:hypothetical protein
MFDVAFSAALGGDTGANTRQGPKCRYFVLRIPVPS